nr:UDP-N-acetylmuramoyl-tripeptide--D-alanyl-D-alanine ligase [Planosporangium thailandense]
MTLAEIAEATGAELAGADPAARVTGSVEFDSRRVGPGGLFVAFAGEKVDGHDYGATAMAAGAVAVLGTRPVEGVPTLVVGDALDALGRLARAVRDRLPRLTVVGITGSSGKTTTKDLISQLLARLGEVVAPAGNFNNELGLPHTVLKATPDTRYLVLEMGARGVGHIRYLCDIARPDIGVEVNVGEAHLGEFGSVERIAAAKSELVASLSADGLAVLNADDARVRAMATVTPGRVLLAGEAADADLRAEDVVVDARGRASYQLVAGAERAAVRLAVTGRHQVGNTLLAAAVATSLGMSVSDAAAALSEAGLVSSRRMDVFDRADGVTVIDDSYNANPSSTAAALRALAELGRGRRTIAVLGYMAELGEYERAGHEEVGRLAAELGVDLLVAVGDQAAPILTGAEANANWGGKSVLVIDQDAAIAVLRDELRSGDVVLCKGSRYRTWDVVDALRETAEVQA